MHVTDALAEKVKLILITGSEIEYVLRSRQPLGLLSWPFDYHP